MEAKDQDVEAYGNRPLPTLEMRDVQSDVPATSSAGPVTPRAATVADAGAENDTTRPHSRVHDDENQEGDVSGGPAARVDRPRDVPDLHR